MLDRYRAGGPIAATTWRKELETLRAFFAWCLDRKWIAENPAKKLQSRLNFSSSRGDLSGAGGGFDRKEGAQED